MSDLIRASALTPAVVDILDVDPVADAGAERLRLAVEDLARDTLTAQAFSLERFAEVMALLPLPFEELFRLYVGKNVLNQFRQDHGYKSGAYVKTWSGREDNEHLIELLDGLEQPETAITDLYSRLEARYPGERRAGAAD